MIDELPVDQLVVAAPHPDDEIFGAGALMRWMVGHGIPVRLVAVTDGEAAWGAVPVASRKVLIERRAGERTDALRQLGIDQHVDVVRLGLPDGRLSEVEVEVDMADQLTEQLAAAGARSIAATWRHDGHPDHEAVGRAAALAAARLGARLYEYLVWAEDRQRLGEHAGRIIHHVPMDQTTRAAKLRAANCFRSQLEPSPDGRPVVPRRLIERLATGPELLVS